MSDDQPSQPSAVDEQKVIGGQAAKRETRTDKDQRRAVADFQKDNTKGQLSVHVKVYSPFRNYYDGQAFSVSAKNATGVFDILPKHHNFISLLSDCELVIRSVNEGEQKIIISGGIMHVKADQVIVFLDV